MVELSPYSGAPVVDEIFVDGRRILITCSRDYAEAKLDYARSVAASQGKRIILEKGDTAQERVSADVLDSTGGVLGGVLV